MIGTLFFLASALSATASATASASTSGPALASADRRVFRYEVREGDTLTDFTARYLTGASAMVTVANASNMGPPRKLRVGEILLVPYRAMRRASVAGNIAAFRGPVKVDNRAAAANAAIAEGARIVTSVDASVTIRFPDGTIATIPSNSRIHVLRLSRYVLTNEVDREFLVEEGGSDWKVTPAKLPGDRMQVRTPLAVSAVRGTEFRVTFRPDGGLSGSSVVKGEVGFTGGAKAAVALPKGYGAVADADAKIDKRTLLAAPSLVDGFALQEGQDLSFQAQRVEGAKSYRFIVARDAGFVDRVAELRQDNPSASVAGLPDGSYFVRSSAIDEVNLEGFATDSSFVRRLNPLHALVPQLVSGRTVFSWVSTSPDFKNFEFTLSRNLDLSQPLLGTSVLTKTSISVSNLKPGMYYWKVTSKRFDGKIARVVSSGTQSLDIERW